MKHIKKFNEIETTNEGLKEWIISGAIALSSVGANAQKTFDTPKGKEYSIITTKSDSLIKLDFDKEFKSGDFKHSRINADSIKQKLSDIAKFVKNNSKKDITIKIDASESQVPNIDIETGKRLPKGALADKRANNTKELIDDFMKALVDSGDFKGTYKIDTTKKIGDTKYVPGVDNKDDSKYTQEQSVGVSVIAKKENTTTYDEYAAYAHDRERIFIGGKAVGDIFYKTKSSTNIRDNGVVANADVLLRTLTPERVFAETHKMYDGNIYLIPSSWWANVGTSSHISQEKLDYIKKNFKVD